MDIISKRSGPRPEDEQAKRHLRQHWGTIERLADTLSGGQYSASKTHKPLPRPEGLIIVDQAARRVSTDPTPYLRISPNGRVVIVDADSGLQMHLVGQLKRAAGETRFVLATAENGFISPLDPEVLEKVIDLGGCKLGREYQEDDLAEELRKRLDLV